MKKVRTKIVVALLLISIVGPVLALPQPASAQFGFGATAIVCIPWADMNCIKELILKPAAKALVKSIINQLRAATINWILKGDFDLKKPFFITSFIADPQKIADSAARLFLSELTGINFCSFHPNMRSINALNINLNLNQRLSCTFGSNYDDFLRDFSNGGFAASFGIVEPQNIFSSSLINTIAEKEKAAVRGVAAYLKEATIGGGFLGQRDPKTGKINTPGRLIANTLMNVQLSQYIGQETFNDIFEALVDIIDTAIGKTIEDGLLKKL